mmetsp:Transcript_53089/g.164507  ORF Transcript_53089/g.164507 Transcript_53089/m.164507 type:complete len:201 (+) Transcript_53089:33-635(+)
MDRARSQECTADRGLPAPLGDSENWAPEDFLPRQLLEEVLAPWDFPPPSTPTGSLTAALPDSDSEPAADAPTPRATFCLRSSDFASEGSTADTGGAEQPDAARTPGTPPGSAAWVGLLQETAGSTRLNANAPRFTPVEEDAETKSRTKLRSRAPSFVPLPFMPAAEVAAAWQRHYKQIPKSKRGERMRPAGRLEEWHDGK